MRPAELLMDIVTDHNGTTGIDCDFCGRTWFTHLDEDYAKLVEKAKAEPKKYCESSDDGLAFGWLDGKQVVFGCCEDKLKRYADWIWNHRGIISTYLKRRAQEELDEALRTVEEVDG